MSLRSVPSAFIALYTYNLFTMAPAGSCYKCVAKVIRWKQHLSHSSAAFQFLIALDLKRIMTSWIVSCVCRCLPSAWTSSVSLRSSSASGAELAWTEKISQVSHGVTIMPGPTAETLSTNKLLAREGIEPQGQTKAVYLYYTNGRSAIACDDCMWLHVAWKAGEIATKF